MRRVGLGVLTAVQILGALGMVAAPTSVFPGAEGDPLAGLTLRLAGYAHLAYVLVAVAVLTRGEERPIRWLAAGQALYNGLAGAEAARVATGLLGVEVRGPPLAMVAMHGTLFAALLIVALWPARPRPTAGPG